MHPTISLVERLDLLNLVITAHEDTRLVVDVLGHDLQHPPHLAVDSLAAGWMGVSAFLSLL